jgi:hypothetical protein
MGRIILIVLAVITVIIIMILTAWVRIILIYDSSFRVYVRIMFLRFRPLLLKKKLIRLSDYSVKALRKKRILMQNRAKKKAKPPKKIKPPTGLYIIKDIRNLFRFMERITLVLIKKFNRSLRVDIKRFTITVANGDAAQTAITYGAVSQAMADLVALLGQYYKIHYMHGARTGVKADFLEDHWSAELNMVFRIRLYHFITLALRAFTEYSKH